MKMAKKRGVLLEYVILLCSVLPLVFASSAMIYTSSFFGGNFGSIGKEIVHYYQRIVHVISYPFP